MALLADRVKETSTTTGTGTLTLAGAVTGFQSFVSAFADADQVFYVIVAVNASGVATGAWEVGIGTVGASGTQLARNVSVYASSNAGALVNFAAGTKQVFVDRPAAGLLPIIVPNGDPLALNAALEEVIGVGANGEPLLSSLTLPAFTDHTLIASGFENIDWDGEAALWIRDSNDAASDKTASLLIGGGSLKSGALITGIGGTTPTVEITPYAEDGETNGIVDIQTGGGDTKLQLTDIGAAEGTILLQVPGASYTLRETPLVVPYVHAFAGGPVLFDSTVTATDVILSGAVSFTPVAIAALHAAPTAGMVQAVNDALGPVTGSVVVAGGAAYALVSYSGSEWFVYGTPN